MTAITSRLQAVNEILRGSRILPVDDLVTQADVRTTLAEETLDQIDRQVQGSGWSFNMREVTLTPVADEITVADEYLRVESQCPNLVYTVRSGKLYDLSNGTAEFKNDTTINVVEYLDWADLPQAARDYITAKAARVFADRQVTDPDLSRVLRQDESETYALLRRHDVGQGNARIWDHGGSGIVDRGSPINRYR